MSDVRFAANREGFRHLRTHGVRAEITRRTEAIAAAAGGRDAGFYVHVDDWVMGSVGRVVAVWHSARRAEAEAGVLSNAIDAGAG